MRLFVILSTVSALLALCVGCGEHQAASPALSPAPETAQATPAVPASAPIPIPAAKEDPPVGDKLELSDDEWRKRLTPEQYQVLRRHGTEPAFCGGYTAIKHNGPGIYHCAGCGAPLFSAGTKFESGSGWPSFFTPLPGRVASEADTSHGLTRTEVHCARCGGHLGHVFDDGPQPTGLRYCINAVCLTFAPASGTEPAAGAAPTVAGDKP